MSYKANSKRRKRQEIESLVQFWTFLLEFPFWDLLLVMFFAENNFFSLV